MNVLVLIPARGGSEGIARKNLRSLAGKPLITYSIENALASAFKPDVYVSSDDDEILSIAAKLGAQPYKRPAELADGETTLDPVIYDAYHAISQQNGKSYDLIVTLQPTSPLLKTTSLDAALSTMIERPEIDTVISAKDDTHLTWRQEGDRFVPNYEERVNRQYLTPIFKETGGFLITRDRIISPNNRIGANVHLHLLSDGEDIDIDTYEQFNTCEYYLKRRTLLFVLTGHHQVGLGHVYRALTLANRIVDYQLLFLLDRDSTLGYEKIKEHKFRAFLQQSDNIMDDILALNPNVVINDILDTDKDYVQSLKQAGMRTINFEDLGTGARHADLVINDMYPEEQILPNHYFGPRYFCARDEFLLTPVKAIKPAVRSVLLTFGGTDTNNLTKKVLEAIYASCREHQIQINVVVGLGYRQTDSLETYPGIAVHQNIRNMADFMHEADVIFTSAGRTIYEIACIGTPAIVMAQNQRETTHFWASDENGCRYLGLGTEVSIPQIRQAFQDVIRNHDLRRQMHQAMMRQNIKQGTPEVIQLIRQTIEQNEPSRMENRFHEAQIAF